MASRALFGGLIVILSLMAWDSRAAVEQGEIICRDGVKDTVPLLPVRTGTPGALESAEVFLGPVETVWARLPSGASISRSQTVPVPVPRTDARRLDVLLDFADGHTEMRTVDVSRARAAGLTEVQVIQTRIEPRSYGLPEGCRLMSPRESRSYALALLNNAGCLLPADVHAALREIPAPHRWGAMLEDCGWEPDIDAAVWSLERAANRGSVHAGWVLAQIYLGDLIPGYQNLSRAYVRMELTGGAGHVSADFMSAVMQWQGIGTHRDPVAAFAALLPYAKTGSPEAQGVIGMMYLTGEGAPLNNVHAYAWCHVAESSGVLVYSDPGACRQIAEARMSSVQIRAALDLSVQIRNGEY